MTNDDANIGKNTDNFQFQLNKSESPPQKKIIIKNMYIQIESYLLLNILFTYYRIVEQY